MVEEEKEEDHDDVADENTNDDNTASNEHNTLCNISSILLCSELLAFLSNL